MTEQPQPLAEDVDADQTVRNNETVQDVVTRLGGRMEGAPVTEVEQALQRELQAAGLPEQPEPWVDAPAREISAGRIVVMDARHQVDPQDLPDK